MPTRLQNTPKWSAVSPKIPISWGELIDKITILEIKSERIRGKAALGNVRKQLSLLHAIAHTVFGNTSAFAKLRRQLRVINERLWDIEDHIRRKEAAGEFDAEFIELARSIYKNNDDRGAKKREIDLKLGSALVEEKSYQHY